mgnify:CR=1 FL=1
MVFDKGLCEFHARLTLPAVCGVRGDDMHGCTVRQIGLTLGNNPVARLEAGNDLGRILVTSPVVTVTRVAAVPSAFTVNTYCSLLLPVRMDSVGTEIALTRRSV